jgi:hypothetical protein
LRFDVEKHEGREGMVHILASAEHAQARVSSTKKRLKLREGGKELREWETGFICGVGKSIPNREKSGRADFDLVTRAGGGGESGEVTHFRTGSFAIDCSAVWRLVPPGVSPIMMCYRQS